MLSAFGWKATIAVAINALGATLLFRKESCDLLGYLLAMARKVARFVVP